MKITVEAYDEKYEVTLSDDTTCDDVFCKMMSLLNMLGYHQDNIDDAITQAAYTLEVAEKDKTNQEKDDA